MTIRGSVVAFMAIIVWSVALPASAQSVTPSFQFWSYKGQTGVEYNAYAERPLGADKKWSLTAWGQKDPDWGQLYAGVSHSFTSWLSAGVGAGVEQDAHPWRVGTSFWMGGRGNDSLLIVETGGSGPWYKYTYTKAVTEKVGLGAYSQRYFGTGPLVQVSIGKSLKLWSAPVTYDTEDGGWKNMTGISYKF